jgi:hypothetical protein
MKSSVTRTYGKIVDVLMFFFLSYIFVDMARRGDWAWLIGVLVFGVILWLVFTKGIDWWYMRRKCPSKWMGMYPCLRSRGHEGRHMSGPNFSGRTIHWDDIEVIPDATD